MVIAIVVLKVCIPGHQVSSTERMMVLMCFPTFLVTGDEG